MKPIFAKIPEDLEEVVFAVRTTSLPYFSTEFHFHKECQMVYVVESEGKRIIGDSVETFQSDELIFLGSDIPHVWHNDKRYFEQDQKVTYARSIALFFHPEKLLGLLSHFGSVKKLELLLKRSQRGMKFSGETKEILKQLLFEMSSQEGLSRLMTLLKVLQLLSTTKEYKLLASNCYINTYQARDNDRIDKVFRYVFSNFAGDIKLEEAAALASMNKQAFCRFFKKCTQKTFVQFVNEIRISHACKLLADSKSSIGGAAYDCGFNSLSNFNRFFKEIKGTTPKQYSKMLTE